MDFELDEQREAVRAMARDFAKAEFAPNAARWDRESVFPREALEAAAALGMAAITVDERYGGSGLGRLESALIFEELAAGCASTAAFLSIHNMVAKIIETHGGDEQRARLLPPLCRFEKTASYCLTEPEAGSDAASLQTKAERSERGFALTGQKAFISGGGVSDLYLVMARTGGAGAHGISAIMVENGADGLSFGAQERKMGWRSQPTAALFFDRCVAPSSNLIGAEGEGFKIAMAALDGGRINIAACSLGGARAALDAALDHVKERKQFGKRLADFQALQFELAEMAIDLDAARLMVWRAAAALDRGDPKGRVHAAKAKRFATDKGFQIVDRALQLFGGYGYLEDYGMERRLRDLRVHRILEGTNQIMAVIVARDLLENGL